MADNEQKKPDTSAENIFRVEGGKYIHNNVEINKDEFDKRKAEADAAIRSARPAPKEKPRSTADRKAAAFSELKKGGEVKFASDRVKRIDGIAQRGKTRGRVG
jgi:hypothetical protein